MKAILATALTLILMNSPAIAGECKLKIARDACPGKETAAYKPYDGKKETEEKKSMGDEAACSKWAEKSSKIIRKGTLSAKRVVGSFDGKDLSQHYEDKKDCQ